MSTTTFRRHQRACLDAAIHRVFDQLGNRHGTRDAFAALLYAARARSNLFDAPPMMTDGVPHFTQLDALRNLARAYPQGARELGRWPGAHGHPLAVIDSLFQQVHRGYRTPRFLAQVWFGGRTHGEHTRRSWVVRHAQGVRFRSFPLPIVMSRQMEHWFLRSPDHLDLDRAFRRAEVLGLGGSPELAAQVLATRLGNSFVHGAYWRAFLTWLVRFEDDLMPGDVSWLVEHFEAIRETQPTLDGRTVASLRRERAERQRVPPPPRGRRRGSTLPPLLTWPRSAWGDARNGEWYFVELLSTVELRAEGHAMRHCVGNYAARCHGGSARIWSLRRSGDPRPSLTIEVDPKHAAVVMVRGYANRRFAPHERRVLEWWTQQTGLQVSGSFASELQQPAAGDAT